MMKNGGSYFCNSVLGNNSYGDILDTISTIKEIVDEEHFKTETLGGFLDI